MIKESQPQSAVTTFKLDGVTKSIAGPVTGHALHSVAGFPDKLTANGKAIEKNTDPVSLDADSELHAEYGDGHGLDQLHPQPGKPAAPAAAPSSASAAPAAPAPITETGAVSTPSPAPKSNKKDAADR